MLQSLSGIAKGVKLIALAVLILAIVGGSLWATGGPLYPVLIGTALFVAPAQLAPAQAGVVYFWAIISGIIGMCINAKKGHSGVAGFLGGVLVGPFWVWLFLFAKRRKKRHVCSPLS